MDYNKISARQAEAILKKAGATARVIEHCRVVRRVALRIARGRRVNKKLVEIAALLHDIGRSRTHGIAHAVEGANVLRELGFDRKVVNAVERHTGSGIGKKEAVKLGLPAKSYIPRTLEEKIVCYADKLVHGNRIVSFEETLAWFEERFGKNSLPVKRLKKLRRDLLG